MNVLIFIEPFHASSTNTNNSNNPTTTAQHSTESRRQKPKVIRVSKVVLLGLLIIIFVPVPPTETLDASLTHQLQSPTNMTQDASPTTYHSNTAASSTHHLYHDAGCVTPHLPQQ